MAKRFVTIFFIVMAIALFLVVGFVMLLFLAPGFQAFGLRYVAYGTRKFDSGIVSISDAVGGSFSNNIILDTKEVPVTVYYTRNPEFRVRYFEDFSGLTRTKIEYPTLDISKDANGNAVIKVNEFEKFIFQNANTKKSVVLYIPLVAVHSSGSMAYRTDLTLNIKSSNLTFEKEDDGTEDTRIATHRNVTIKSNGRIDYKTEVRAKKFEYETNSSIIIGEDKLSTINAEDYTLTSGGRIELRRETVGDVKIKTNNRHFKFIRCKNLYAETGHGSISCYKKDAEAEAYGIVRITTKSGNITLGNVKGDGKNEIKTGSGNVKINSIKDGTITTQRGSVNIVSVRDMAIDTNMGKVTVEEALSKLDVKTKRGKITVGGEGMTVNNPTLFSRLGKITLNSGSGNVYIETVSSDVKFTNTNSSNIKIYSGGELNATGLQGKVDITAAENVYTQFNSISGDTKINVSDKCASIVIFATDDLASETRYILSGKLVTRYEEDPTDDVAAYKIDSAAEFTNKKDGTGPLLDVYGKNADIQIYFKIENVTVAE